MIERDGIPSIRLPAGEHQVVGKFRWDAIPQRMAIPREVGILSLSVNDNSVQIPNWDANGNVWLKRVRSEVADKDFLKATVHRVLEDGIPMWLRTEIELAVSGKSREEELGWVLPDGWILAMVDSPIPVAVDDRGRMRAQVRAGQWTIAVHAFRTTDLGEFQYASDAQPITDGNELGSRPIPSFAWRRLKGFNPLMSHKQRFQRSGETCRSSFGKRRLRFASWKKCEAWVYNVPPA